MNVFPVSYYDSMPDGRERHWAAEHLEGSIAQDFVDNHMTYGCMLRARGSHRLKKGIGHLDIGWDRHSKSGCHDA